MNITARDVTAREVGAVTEPVAMETRKDCIARLRQAVTWVNHHRADYFSKLCVCQKEWAQELLDEKGIRLKH